MEQHRKDFYLTFFAILLAYVIGKFYDNAFLYFIPGATPVYWIFSSLFWILIFIGIIYWLLYHDKKDFLN
ncbi:MAG: hypothetical protein NTW67_02250 [Candidatus Woesearchaeota archaeon]|nr:hypothetical protein [Candidatus Woesearchaeota archaeon]